MRRFSLLAFGLIPDEHFQQATALECLSPPQSAHRYWTSRLRGSLREVCQDCVAALCELKRRWQPLTQQLRQFQTQGIRAVTAKRDIGFTAVLVVLLSWVDTSLPFGLVRGLPAVGFAPCYGVFPQQPARRIPVDEVFDGWQSHNAQILSRIGPGKNDDFVLEQSQSDASKGFCTPPLTRRQILRILGGHTYRLIPRCVITQASGKQRVIDDAAGGGSLAAIPTPTSWYCVPRFGQPKQRPYWPTCHRMSGILVNPTPSTGNENLPDVYWHCPMSMDEARAYLVVSYYKDWDAPAFQLYAGLLFGLSLAITSFNHYNRFSDAAFRRLALIFASIYFDD